MANAMAFLAPHNQFRAMGLSVAPAAMLEDVIAQYQAPLIVNVGSCDGRNRLVAGFVQLQAPRFGQAQSPAVVGGGRVAEQPRADLECLDLVDQLLLSEWSWCGKRYDGVAQDQGKGSHSLGQVLQLSRQIPAVPPRAVVTLNGLRPVELFQLRAGPPRPVGPRTGVVHRSQRTAGSSSKRRSN